MTARRFGLLCYFYLGIYKASIEQMEAFGKLVQAFVEDGATEDDLKKAILFALDIPVTVPSEEKKIAKVVGKAMGYFKAR